MYFISRSLLVMFNDESIIVIDNQIRMFLQISTFIVGKTFNIQFLYFTINFVNIITKDCKPMSILKYIIQFTQILKENGKMENTG